MKNHQLQVYSESDEDNLGVADETNINESGIQKMHNIDSSNF